MKKKWSLIDIIVLIFTIASPIISVVITCVVPAGVALSDSIKTTILCGGISIPIVLIQTSINIGQNKTSSDLIEISKKIQEEQQKIQDISRSLSKVSDVRNQLGEISDILTHINPILEKIFLSNNDQLKRFAYRRMKETEKVINSALNNNTSGMLRPNEYYEELLYLSNLISQDKIKNGDNFSGEIWAMTSFAENEWIADEGYEKLWTDKLKSIMKMNIKTRRLCIIPNEVYRLISSRNFVEPAEEKKSFWGLVGLLKTYYHKDGHATNTNHFFLKENDNKELRDLKGFFAIKLTSGELHILCGENVDEHGGLTAQELFDNDEILKLYELFERYAIDAYSMAKVIKEISDTNGFIEFLNKNDIIM